MTETEHAQWIRQFWLDKSDEMKTDLNEAVRIAYQQGRKDALEVLDKIRAEIEETIESYVCDKEENTMKAQGMLNAMQMTFDIIDKCKGDKE